MSNLDDEDRDDFFEEEDEEDTFDDDNEEEDVLNAISVPEKSGLSDPCVDDSCLFSELPDDAKPVKPLPPDERADVEYDQLFVRKCVLCRSAFRTLAEHVYIANGWKPYSVMSFFKEYFNARISWDCVDTHMRRHCRLDKMQSSGLQKLVMAQNSLAIWEYREAKLAIQLIIDEIDEIKGLNCQNRPDLKIKQSEQIRKLARDLDQMARKRDESANKCINMQQILMDIWGEITDDESKAIIIRKVQEVQKLLNE